MTVRTIMWLLAILFMTASQAEAAGVITVKDINDYLPSRHFNYVGPGPNLIYSNADQKTEAEAYAASTKFSKGNKTISPIKDAHEAVKQINFTALICNPPSETPIRDLKPELQSLKDDKKKLLQAETIALAKHLFNADIPEDTVAELKEGEKLDTPTFSLAYMEHGAKCDTNGGRSIYYKIFPKTR